MKILHWCKEAHILDKIYATDTKHTRNLQIGPLWARMDIHNQDCHHSKIEIKINQNQFLKKREIKIINYVTSQLRGFELNPEEAMEIPND